MVVPELTPTNERLAAFNLTDTNRCITRGSVDTIQHRLTQCGESQVIWNWTCAMIAAVTRTHLQYIPETWTIQPDFRVWPPPRQKALMWVFAHVVDYHMHGQHRISLLDKEISCVGLVGKLNLSKPDALRLEITSPCCKTPSPTAVEPSARHATNAGWTSLGHQRYEILVHVKHTGQ
jgi:hypothetical protein